MKLNGIKILILSILLVSLVFAAEKDREVLFKQGVSAYVAEDYETAIKVFSQIAESETVSWELYYNLANSYYRNGELGRAIQYWEKAKVLSPSQSDVNHNLSIANQLLIDKVVLPDMFPLFRWYSQFRKQLPLEYALMMTGFLLMIMLLLIGLVRLRQRKNNKVRKAPYISIVSIFMSLIIIITAITIDTAHTRKKESYAIILEKEVNILSEPVNDATVLFILHEGSKVKINKNIEDSWTNISYFDDKVGWIQNPKIGRIQE